MAHQGRPSRTRAQEESQLQERRWQVATLLVKRLKANEIASALDISPATVSRDIASLKQTAFKSLFDLAKSDMPFFFDLSLLSCDEVIRSAWELFHTTTNESVKVRCLRVIILATGQHYLMLRGGKGLMSMSKVRDEISQLRQECEEWKARTLGR